MLTVPRNRPERKQNRIVAPFSHLGWPLLWGIAASVAFYWGLDQDLVPGKSLLHRLLIGHPVAFIETTLLFVGLAALTMQATSALRQHLTLDQIQLPTPPAGGERAADDACQQALAYLAALPARLQEGCLARRCRAALEHVEKTGTAHDLDDHLRALAAAAASRQHESYALARLLMRAIPVMGLVGTFMGIAAIAGSLQPGMLTSEQGIAVLSAAFVVAFNLTVTGIACALVLLCAQFVVERVETSLLTAVDELARAMFVGRFQQVGTVADPQAAAVRRMADVVVRASEELVARQAELWQDTIEAAHQQWSQLSGATGQQVQQALDKSLTRGLMQHAQHITTSEKEAREQLTQTGDRVAAALDQLAKSAEKQHAELARQGATLVKALDTTTRTLQAHALLEQQPAPLGARSAEETLTSLAAAIHLLNSRLAGLSTAPTSVKMQPAENKGRAA